MRLNVDTSQTCSQSEPALPPPIEVVPSPLLFPVREEHSSHVHMLSDCMLCYSLQDFPSGVLLLHPNVMGDIKDYSLSCRDDMLREDMPRYDITATNM